MNKLFNFVNYLNPSQVMFWTRSTILTLFFPFLCLPVFSQQAFPCDGRLILSAISSNTSTYSINFGIGAAFFSQNSVFLGEHFDGLGFNPKDNYIYGVQENTNAIVRLHADGSHKVLGSVDSLVAYAGDCSPDGLYLCHDNVLNQILVFEVVNNFQLLNRLDLFWNPFSQNSGSFTTRIDDFAIDPNNPKVAYAFQARYYQDEYDPPFTRGYLLKINLDFTDVNAGMVTPIAAIPSDVILQLGSLFFNKEGELFGFGPYTNGPFVSNRLIAINPFTGAVYNQWQGLSTPASDGCSCPYSLSFENEAFPRGITCSNSELTYALTINNRSNEALSGLTVTDTIPAGMIIKGISGNFSGTIAAGTGVGTRILTINDLKVAPRGRAVINIETDILDIPIGITPNQAFLSNLPPLFGGSRISDDPQTTGYIGDATNFASDQQAIDNVTVVVRPPSNCLNPVDAQILISSPILLPNQPYQIKLINQYWEEFDFNVIIDNDHAFVLDSLMPGKYQLYQVTPENSKCSFKWKDTTILINPPNEQLQASAESNSPVCEGSSLSLRGTISPGGTVSWTGPAGFASSNLNPILDSVRADQSGKYKMVATYGACEQTRTLEIFVPPGIQASIDGKTEYCEREDLQLVAVGNGDLQAFHWSGPDIETGTNPQLQVLSMAPANGGLYQVIIDNGYCKDTASAMISVLPSPTISLPERIETEFCEPLKLQPQITGDRDVSYSWTPNEGLSCYQCQTPELLVPFLPDYQLTVINEQLCTDTAVVKIALSKEKLIYVPNAFSPNFDGTNDYFQLFPGCGVAGIKDLKIFDRSGAIVYSQRILNYRDPQEYWNGVISGQVGAMGVYLWQAEIELVDGTSLRLTGDVSLIR